MGASTAQADRGASGGRPARRGVVFVRSSELGTALAPPPPPPAPGGELRGGCRARAHAPAAPGRGANPRPGDAYLPAGAGPQASRAAGPEPGRCPTPAILAGRAVRKPQPPLTIWVLPLVYRFPNCVLKKLAPKFKGSGKCVWACDIHRVPVWGCCRPPSFPISLGQTPWQDPLQDPTPRVQCRREQAPIPGSGTGDRREMRGVGCGGGGGQAGG